MPLGIFKEGGLLVARSPFGASYGGIVVKDGLSLQVAQDIVLSLIKYLRGLKIDKFIFVLPPLINFVKPHNYLDFCFIKEGAKCIDTDLTSYIEIIEDPLKYFKYSAVKAVRKAIANKIRFEENNDIDNFYDILRKNRSKFNAAPTHSFEDIKWLLKNMSDHIKLFMCYKENIAIAGSLIFRLNKRVILDFYWAHLDEYQQYRPISLLVYEITKWAYTNHYKYFDFGTQTFNMIPREGNTRFKETFGAVGIFRNTYQFDIS